ncbi:photosynthetic complex putative assembly protein PuhB [Limimaricola pyoseonensis]|uniref:PH domain-containing protein n=1 Tax=Limimaricola pyoseonensis TaxID=521013 RepID=A0A1G7B0B0_9RHOB|nr:photosynthetic complex putative assembly protein PuhB [Limimaricola pyoseonensis]SDE20483.1 PH domain-containing protein [Limimaricola pyoseonensis]
MSHDDFAHEPIPGLPERPPNGEHILWQGRPGTWALAREALALHWVAGWFVLLFGWRFATLVDLQGPVEAARLASPFLILGGAVCALLLAIAWVQARATLYTITTARVAMRIGAALTVTFNLPYAQLASADLQLRRDGHGTIALEMSGPTRLGYLICWPHVRPWHLRHPKPALRCIPDAARVARLLSDAAQARLTRPRLGRTAPGPALAAE